MIKDTLLPYKMKWNQAEAARGMQSVCKATGDEQWSDVMEHVTAPMNIGEDCQPRSWDETKSSSPLQGALTPTLMSVKTWDQALRSL